MMLKICISSFNECHYCILNFPEDCQLSNIIHNLLTSIKWLISDKITKTTYVMRLILKTNNKDIITCALDNDFIITHKLYKEVLKSKNNYCNNIIREYYDYFH